MTVVCPTCRGKGSTDPRCIGPHLARADMPKQSCRRRTNDDNSVSRRCNHAACVTCNGKGTVDNEVWFGEGNDV